jgi:hypothetical protein
MTPEPQLVYYYDWYTYVEARMSGAEVQWWGRYHPRNKSDTYITDASLKRRPHLTATKLARRVLGEV